ncbi:MAG TPA: complex I NDUFA9 subunit family protein [Steroidobacteraceae bacterium]
MEITTVCVLGGSGFIGRHVCHALAAAGYRVRVATRDRERAKEQLILLPTVDVAAANIHDPAQLAMFVRGADAVINLVGVLHDGRGNRSFQAAHIELARKVVAACRSRGIGRLLHMSALASARGAPSRYLRTKGEAEAIVRESGLAWTLYRPSVVFGPGDGFLNLFATVLRFSPVVALACPGARFQPVFVEDVAAAFVKGLADLGSFGKSYDLCGPRVYTLRELVEYVGTVTGRRRPVVGLNDALSYCQALAMELLPVKLMTRDNYYSMKVDNVCSCDFPFGIAPAALEAVAPSYLGRRTPRARYQAFRERGHRDERVNGES